MEGPDCWTKTTEIIQSVLSEHDTYSALPEEDKPVGFSLAYSIESKLREAGLLAQPTPSAPPAERCMEKSEEEVGGYWTCSLTKGHTGNHIAREDHRPDGKIVMKWANRAAPESHSEEAWKEGNAMLGISHGESGHGKPADHTVDIPAMIASPPSGAAPTAKESEYVSEGHNSVTRSPGNYSDCAAVPVPLQGAESLTAREKFTKDFWGDPHVRCFTGETMIHFADAYATHREAQLRQEVADLESLRIRLCSDLAKADGRAEAAEARVRSLEAEKLK